jgi:hypothetical protein
MPDHRRKIEVGFHGALKSGGRIFLPMPATIKSGLDAVGGLAPAKRTMWPAGIIRVRRRKYGRMAAFRQFDMSDPSGEWKRFKLQDGDAVIFQWHVVVNDSA